MTHPVIAALAASYAEIPEVEAVALGGSQATGAAGSVRRSQRAVSPTRGSGSASAMPTRRTVLTAGAAGILVLGAGILIGQG